MDSYDREARLFSALSHPVRLQILDVLAQSEACVCHLCAALEQRQAYVSQQLATLKDAGLIADRKEGLYVYYRLADAVVARLLRDTRASLARLSGDDIVRQVRVPRHGEIECSCPQCLAKRAAGVARQARAESTSHLPNYTSQ